MKRFTDIVEAVNTAIGKAVSLLIFAMIGVIAVEVVGRYFFNAPTPWAHDVSSWLQVVYVFLGGAFALHRGYMVRVDILYTNFPPRVQAAVDLSVSTVLFGCFAYVMLWKGGRMGLQSFNMGETSATGVWDGPVWPFKLMVPLGVALVTLAWTSLMMQQAVRLFRPDAAPRT